MANKEKASQEFVPIKEVRDGVLVLDDGSLRGILLTSSVNFALKSLDTQQAIIYQFQNFLNLWISACRLPSSPNAWTYARILP